MDIDNQVNNIVQNIFQDITAKVQVQVAAVINQKISAALEQINLNLVLSEQIEKRLSQQLKSADILRSIEQEIQHSVDRSVAKISDTVQNSAIESAASAIGQQVSNINFQQVCQAALTTAIQNRSFTYPESSIPYQAISQSGWVISGDQIQGGIIQKFGSTGIDDRATQCQLTILDDATVVENNLLTRDLTVKGTVTIEGDLLVTGQVPENSQFYLNLVKKTTDSVKTDLDQDLFNSYSNLIYNQIKESGLDLSQLRFNGQEILNGNSLGSQITSSNLQRVGQLQELQVAGESLLSQTLYTTNQRVGINTVEPATALDVWDQEVEITVGKTAKDTATIQCPRNQSLILSSNNKNNLKIETDGSVSINALRIGLATITSSTSPPSDNRPAGTIVFNAVPNYGGPIGWVSLGGARWANFGVID
jgi:hypothetical protein